MNLQKGASDRGYLNIKGTGFGGNKENLTV